MPLVLYAAGLGRGAVKCVFGLAVRPQVLGLRLGRDSSAGCPWERVPGKGTVGEGLDELLRAVVSCRWSGGAARRG